MENIELSRILSFAKQHFNTLSEFKYVNVILGNVTCDLDSAVSSLVYSLIIQKWKNSSENIVIPVFNIPRVQLPIKTEVTYLLKKYGFNLEDFVCRDEIDLKSLHKTGSLRLVLVDHHVLHDTELEPSVIAVIDHRPPDRDSPWAILAEGYPEKPSRDVDVTFRNVGSCCSLVGFKILDYAPELVTPMIATWLLGTILIDTACLSPSEGKAQPIELELAKELLELCDLQLDKEQLYNELKAAKEDISSLTTAQMLIKDLKIASGIPIVGLPIKVKDFVKIEDAERSLLEFCDELNVVACVIYGQKVEQGIFTKDIGVFTRRPNSEIAEKIEKALVNCKEPHLDLKEPQFAFPQLVFFEQRNLKVSRKDFLPLVKKVAKSLKSK